MSEATRVQLGHGSGGRLTHELIHRVFAAKLTNPVLDPLDDAGMLPAMNGRLAMTTDSFVVSPLFFNGGDIGTLAINGTVNDLAVSGAHPAYLTLAAILEEGLPFEVLERVVDSIAAAARQAKVLVVSGDTKVVERGKGDQVFLTTAGVGVVRSNYPREDRQPRAGDAILVSGSLGDHGAVVLAARSQVELSGSLASDCAPVTPLVDALFAAGIVPFFMRDPTRGGLAGVLCDLAEQVQLGVELEEQAILFQPDTMTLCDLVGVDPLHLACEGRVVALVAAEECERALAAWRALAPGAQASCIGHLTAKGAGLVSMRTRYGGARRVVRPTAELLPRIC